LLFADVVVEFLFSIIMWKKRQVVPQFVSQAKVCDIQIFMRNSAKRFISVVKILQTVPCSAMMQQQLGEGKVVTRVMKN